RHRDPSAFPTRRSSDLSTGFKENEKNAGVRIRMAGSEVFKYAVKALDAIVDETLEANNLDRHDLDWLIPHQANLRIIEATARRLDRKSTRLNSSHVKIS